MNHMGEETNLKEIKSKVLLMRKTAEELKNEAGNFPALYRNLSRILASIKMMELNLPDAPEHGNEG